MRVPHDKERDTERHGGEHHKVCLGIAEWWRLLVGISQKKRNLVAQVAQELTDLALPPPFPI